MAEKLTQEQFLERAKLMHGGKYDYSLTVYRSSGKKIIVICPVHGEFEQIAREHLKGGCRRCANQTKANNLRITQEEFIRRARERHGDIYDYSNTNYVSMKNQVIVICPYHGEFRPKAVQHLQYGCMECANRNKGQWKKLNTEIFISRASNVHQQKYDYSKVSYQGSQIKVCITCSEHGDFSQHPDDHLSGHGCGQCSAVLNGENQYGVLKVSFSEFEKRADDVHQGKYTYDESTFGHRDKRMTIMCPEHGEFQQNRNNHIFLKHGCPECGRKKRRSQNEWLDYMGVINREVTIRIDSKRVQADGYDAETNTIYEFNGDFWHGNPDVYKDMNALNIVTKTSYLELYEKTLRKRDLILGAGYNLVEIWETDWIKIKNEKNRQR